MWSPSIQERWALQPRLISVTGDIDITELVDRNKDVHVMMPKAVFAERK